MTSYALDTTGIAALIEGACARHCGRGNRHAVPLASRSFGMSVPPRPTVERALQRTAERVAVLRQIVQRGLRGWRTTGEEDVWLRAMLGVRSRLSVPLASNLWLRQRATEILIEEVLTHWRARPPGRRYALVTFIDDMGNTFMREPRLNPKAFRDKVDHALRATGLNAVVALELQALNNYPRQGYSNAMMLHAHALVWTDDPEWNADAEACYDACALEIGANGAWFCAFDAEPVLPRLIKDTEGDMAVVAAYISKVPSDGTLVWLRRKAIRTRTVRQDYRPAWALRIIEALSQLPLSQLVFAINDGKEIVAPWRSRMLKAFQRQHPSRVAGSGVCADVAASWWSLRQHRIKSRHGTAVSWLTGTRRPPSIHVSDKLDIRQKELSHRERLCRLRDERATSPLSEL